MFGVSGDDLFSALTVFVGIFGSGLYTAWKIRPGSPGLAPNYTAGRRVFAMVLFGGVMLASIIAYLVHAQLRYGTLVSLRTLTFAIFSIIIGVLYTWSTRLLAGKPRRTP